MNFIAFLLVLKSVALSYQSKVALNNNEYTGLVIAINPAINESAELVEAIKESWTNASASLFVATDNRAFFKAITILLPKNWKTITGTSATWENYNEADVVVAPQSTAYGNAPYTMQYDGCGKPGMYTYFTPEYFLNNTSVTNYGPRGKVIVHEWAHYRWGVFDETSDQYPFYFDPRIGDSNGPVATKCPLAIQGEVRDTNTKNAEGHCDLNDLDPATDMYPANCVFFPYEDQSPYYPNTSIMSYQFMDEITTFCRDDSSVEGMKHNIYAPNDQNRLCEMKSTWTVIENSPDFANGKNPQNLSVTSTVPQFNIVQIQSDRRYVLVLDVSGSMAGDKLTLMKAAANFFITTAASDGSWVGIVKFASDADTVSELEKLETTSDRNNLADQLLSLNANGGTSIGDGIEEGIKVLNNYNSIPDGGYLLVLTDGEENQYKYISDVRDSTIASNVIVYGIFIETNGSPALQNLSLDTGGSWFSLLDASSSADLISVFNQISEVDDGDFNSISFQLQSVTFPLTQSDDQYTSNVVVDYTVGANTVFTFTWSNDNLPPNIYLQTPNGCVYANLAVQGNLSVCSDNPIDEVLEDFVTIRFVVPGVAETGTWKYEVNLSSGYSQTISAVVTSMAADKDVPPILVESGLSSTDLDPDSPTIVYAKVTQGYSPVLGANVIATIYRPSGDSVNVILLDSGAGADIRENDGIYSRYFVDYDGQGRYNVQVEVSHANASVSGSATGSKASYRPGVINSDGSLEINPSGPKSPDSTAAVAGVESTEIGEFSRVVSTGGFTYSGSLSPSVDNYPPSKITDAKVNQNDVEDFTKGLVLTFTAPGNDYDAGVASGYDIRYTFGDPSTLLSNFNESKNVNQTDVLSGNLTNPLPSGSVESFTFKMPELPNNEDSVRLSVAVRAFDNYENYADPSNVAVTNFFITPLAISPATTSSSFNTTAEIATTPMSTTTQIKCEECDPNTELYMILMVSFGALGLALLATVIVLSIWLSKVNKHAKHLQKSILRGERNPYDLELEAWEAASKNNKTKTEPKRVLPVLTISTKDGMPVIAYIPEENARGKSLRASLHGLDF